MDQTSYASIDFDYPQNKEETLRLIRRAIEGKMADINDYESLIRLSPNEEAVRMLQEIIQDDRTHETYFRLIFQDLTDETPNIIPPNHEIPNDYYEGIKQAIMRKSRRIELDRRILFGMHDHLHIHMLTEIITDELRHGTLLNLLFLVAISAS